MSPTQHQYLCLSQLAAGCRVEVFAAICSTSRSRNAALGIRGVLLFDGHRFAHLLQGPTDAVLGVMKSIAADRRHEQLKVLVVRPLQAAPPLRDWTCGFCEHDALDSLDGAVPLQGDEAVAEFHAIVERADLAP